MRKIFSFIVILFISTFAFCEELTGFEDIPFGTNKDVVISCMEQKGYKTSFPGSNMVSFVKDNETFLNAKVKEYVFIFSNNSNKFQRYSLILERHHKLTLEIPKRILQSKNKDSFTDMISSPVMSAFKISLSENSCIILLDTYFGDYVINYYPFDIDLLY